MTCDLGPCQPFEITYWTASLIALIGFSRVFLGVHFATDVVGGFLLGGAWLMVGIALSEWARARTK
jgi:membrane-associated phospholipid phosphatase